MRGAALDHPTAERRRALSRLVRLMSWLALASIALGCDRSSPSSPGAATEAAGASGLRPKHDSVATIPEGPVKGQLGGAPFVVRDARFIVDRRDGHERVDLLLSDATSLEPCGALDPAEPARLWLRKPGAELPSSGETRITPPIVGEGLDARSGGDHWQAHYQIKEAGRWVGHGTAAAIVHLESRDASLALSGSISVCFADGRASCAAGSFVAHYCPSELDRPLRGVEPTESPATAPLRPAVASSQPAP